MLVRLAPLVVVLGCRANFDDLAVAGDGDGGTGDGRTTDGTGAGDDGALGDGSIVAGQPLVWFRFDEPAGTGTVTNSGTVASTIMASFAAQGVGGAVGNAIEFTNMNHGVELADHPVLDGLMQVTIEGWINFNAFNMTDYSTIAKKDQGYILRTCDVCGGVIVSFIIFDSLGIQRALNIAPPAQPNQGTWYHVAGTYDGTAMPYVLRAYWEGSEIGTTTTSFGTGALFDSANLLAIGRHQVMGEELDGRVDEVKVWAETRTPQQICESAGKTWSGSCN